MSKQTEALQLSILALGLLKNKVSEEDWQQGQEAMLACVEALREPPPKPIGIVMANIYPASVTVGLYEVEELPLGTKVFGKPN